MNKQKSFLTLCICSFAILAVAAVYSDKKESKENITTLVYGSPPNDLSSFSLMQLEMIPELLYPSHRLSDQWPQIPLDVPENRISLKSFERFPKLKILAFNFGNGVAMGNANLPELEELALYHADLGGLSQLQVPKLRTLFLNNCRTGSREELPATSQGLKELHFYDISPDTFHYASLTGRKLEALTLWNCKDDLPLEFLKGMPLKRLSLSVRELSADNFAILTSLPLEELTLKISDRDVDFSFLTRFKLRKLHLYMRMPNKMKLEYLKGMPLESLQLLSWDGRDADGKILEAMPLKELVLIKCGMNDPGFLAKLPLENLVLQECYWKDAKVLEAISQISTLRNLFIGPNFHARDTEYIYINDDLSWNTIRNPQLETLVFYGPADFNFCHNLKELKSLKYLTSAERETDISSLKGQSLECLVIKDAEKQKEKLKEMDVKVKKLLELRSNLFRNKTPENQLFNIIWWIN